MRVMPLVRLENFQQFAAINVLSDPGLIPGPKTAPNCAQISLVWQIESGKQAHIVLGGRYSGGFAGTTAQALAILNALSSGAQWTALAAFLSTTSSLSAVFIRDINTPNNPIIQSGFAGGAGTSVSPSMPNEVAVALSLHTAFTGPANRGRAYVPGWATNALGAGNVVAAGAVTALGNWGNTLSTALSAQGYTLVIVQPQRAAYTGSTGRVHPARTATSTPVTSVTVRDNHWDSQRRRGLK